MLKAANSSCLIQDLSVHRRPKAKHPYFNIHRHGPASARAGVHVRPILVLQNRL